MMDSAISDAQQVNTMVSQDTPTSDTMVKEISTLQIITAPSLDANAGEKNANPTDTGTNAPKIYGEKFCDVKVMDGKVVVENYVVNGEKINSVADLKFKNFDMKNLQIIYMKDKNIVFLQGDHGICKIKFSVDGSAVTNGLQIPSLVSPKFVKSNDNSVIAFTSEKTLFVANVGDWPPQQFAHDGSEFFTHQGAVYDDPAKGIFIATTPTTLFVKVAEKINVINYDLQFGEGPPFVDPKITSEKGMLVIKDPSMPDQYMLYDPINLTIGLYGIKP